MCISYLMLTQLHFIAFAYQAELLQVNKVTTIEYKSICKREVLLFLVPCFKYSPLFVILLLSA